MNQKTKDNFIYLGVGLTVAAGFIIYMFYTERTTGRIQEIPAPILWGILSTPCIIGLIFERFWKYRRSRSLWVTSIAVTLINISAMFIAYFFHWNPPAIVWSTITLVCLIAVFAVAQKIVVGNHSK